MSSPSAESQACPGAAPIQDLITALLATRSQAHMVDALRRAERPVISKSVTAEIKTSIQKLAEHIHAKRHREAVATILALVFVDANLALSRIRREGILRPSKYGYKGHLIGSIAKAALQIQTLTNITPERIEYLESIIALSNLATNACALYDEILATVRSRREAVLKTLLVILNSQFYTHWINDPLQPSTSLRRYTSEEFSDAVSLIFSIYTSLFPITVKCFRYVDLKAITTEEAVYERLLLASVRLLRFQEAETLVDGLPYKASISEQTITVASIDPNIERSVRLGYIQNDTQAVIRARRFSKADQPLSVEDMVEKGFEHGAFESLIELVEQPVKRFRLVLPSAPELFSIFSDDAMFRDEIIGLLFLDVNNFGDVEDLIADVNEHVTSTDILKFQRYFAFLSLLYQKRLARVENEAERMFLTFTSTIIVIPHKDLFMQLLMIFKSEEKVQALIDLFKMTVRAEHLDLQYRPLIDIDEHYVIAPHLLTASNLVRNAIVANRLRQTAIGAVDPMVKAVVNALKQANFEVESDVKLRAGGQDLELDVIARRDGHLFFFECKNAYHPCSAHEMRNSYDHLKDGRDQLDKRRRIFLDPIHQSILLRKLNWTVGPTTGVHTGIIIANRIFHGAVLNGHPVRQAHELINVLLTGKIAGGDRSLTFWSGHTFQTNDLITYLEGDSIVTTQLAALEPTDWEFTMGYRQLVFSSYVLDPEKLHQTMETNYPAAGHANETGTADAD